MLVDFKEIEDKSGFQFERFVQDLLEAIGWTIVTGAGQGPDGGRDIIASVQETSGTGKVFHKKYLIQCKHHAYSNKTVLPSDLNNFSLMPSKHKTQGWLLVTSTKVSESVVQDIDAANNKNDGLFFDYWDAENIEKQLLTEKCRSVLIRYFPKSYAKNTHLIIPALSEIQGLIDDWKLQYQEYAAYFLFDSQIEESVYPYIVSEKLTLQSLKDTLFSNALVSEFMDIWKSNLIRGDIPGGCVLLVRGLKKLQSLKNKGLSKDSITSILTSEIALTAPYRDLKHRYWQEFIVHTGSSYEWCNFEINYGRGYFPPSESLCGMLFMIYCENYGESAAGSVLINEEQKELNFIASYQLESHLEFVKFPLNIPFNIKYKLEKRSDPVVFLVIGFASQNGIDEVGNPCISWNRLI